MFFLIRTVFWLSVLLLVLPIGGEPSGDGPSATDRASIDALAALAAAGAAASDVGGFCARQPGACDVGGQALKLVGERARSGASAIQEYLADQDGAAKSGVAKDGAVTGVVSKGVAAKGVAKEATSERAAATGSAAGARQTLSPADRKPAWRGPAA